jgi:protein gp37
MAQTTKIEWTDHTFNPWRGCTHAVVGDGTHPGCDHCYAEQLSQRNPGTLGVWGAEGQRVRGTDSYWRLPLKWNKAAKLAGVRRRVFCASLADVFEDWAGPIVDTDGRELWTAPEEPGRYCPWGENLIFLPSELANMAEGRYIPARLDHLRADLFRLIDATPHLDWQLLTKRPQNVSRMWPEVEGVPYVAEAGRMNDWPLNRRWNVWLGTSVSNQATADELLPHLAALADLCPVRFVSAEPLLGPVNLLAQPQWLWASSGINWLIAGGESGHQARPMHPQWVRGLRDQCTAAGVPFFFKQWGEWEPSFEWPDQFADVSDTCAATYLAEDGHRGQSFAEMEGHANYGLLIKAGKKHAGRELTGRVWSEFPAKGVTA